MCVVQTLRICLKLVMNSHDVSVCLEFTFAALKDDETLAQVISSVEERYAADERVQLDLVADHFVTAFREADLPFNKLLTDQPLEKVRREAADAVSDPAFSWHGCPREELFFVNLRASPATPHSPAFWAAGD